ncbi:MAG: KOW domain-containing RNA-binding protein [Clostridia bacterium]|nr:KOW domain-containing RNA-binding protein [Clostridia bacterium]
MKKKRLKKDAKDEMLAVPDRTDARVGSVCVSMAGHDAGLLLTVVAGIDRDHVFTADGKTRKLNAPKKKKMRHLSMITKLSEEETEAIRKGTANDSFLRKALSSLDLEGFT